MEHLIDRLIAQYGLLAVFVGSLAEGETAAILGGFFAHQQAFDWWQTVLAAFAGAVLGDTAFFLVGRHFSRHPWIVRLRTRPGFDRADALLRRHPDLFVLANRYLYGVRLAGGVAAGLTQIAFRRFLLLNALSALVWALLFSSLGYAFGLGAQQLLGRALHAHQRLLLALLVLLAAIGLALFSHRREKRRRGR